MREQTDFLRWAIVSYNDDTGLGRMATDACRVLGVGHHIVHPSKRLATKPLKPGDFLLAVSGGDDNELREFLSVLDGVIVLETPSWTPTLLPIAKELGLSVVAVPMWEWFNPQDKNWFYCDWLFCPNRKCLEVVRSNGFANSIRVTWPLDLTRLPKRKVVGPATRFVHNAGLVDRDDRKATREVISAFRKVKGPHLRLDVRLQQPAELPEVDERISVRIGNLDDPAVLWAEGDVAVQPSKLEGIGFMVLEPICAGLPVITQDVAPMNEYAVELLIEPAWISKPAFSSQWAPQARLKSPSLRGLARCIERAAQIDLSGISARQRAWAEETFDPGKLREEWSRAVTHRSDHQLAMA